MPKTIEDILKETRIYEILRPKLVTALPDIRLKDAIALMQREKSGYIVIADQHLKVTGLFTERDVLMNVLGKNASLDEPVTQYMHTNPKTLKKSDTIGDALQVMNDTNVRHVPLVDEFGQMNGVLSVRTIANFISELFPTEIFNLPPRANQIHETVEGG